MPRKRRAYKGSVYWMPVYLYDGKDGSGKMVRGKRTAADETALYAALRQDDIFLVSCREEEAAGAAKKRLKPMELSEFCRQIASMTAAGITLSRAMGILLMGDLKPSLATVYREVQKRIQQGVPLSEAMAEQGVFPDMMVNMFRAGEASGQMEQVAAKMADHYQKEHRMNSRVKSATLYPKILGVVCVAAVLIIFLGVMPTLEPMFEGMAIPAFTQVLMNFSAFLQTRWYVLLIAALLVVLAVKLLLDVPAVRLWWDRAKLHTPLVGKRLRIIYTARFSRSQASLYSSGLSMIRSLEIAATTVGNTYITSQFDEVVKQVRSGEMLSKAIQTVDGFDPKLAPTIFVGEETGQLDQMLDTVADNYEYESDVALQKLTGMLEPVMIVFMGVIVAIIMLGVLVPIWNMYGNVGNL